MSDIDVSEVHSNGHHHHDALVLDQQQRLAKLKEDNDVLRSMLRRAMGDAVSKQQTNANKDMIRKAASVEKVQEELRLERDRRLRAEKQLTEMKAQWDSQRTLLEGKLLTEANKVKHANMEHEKLRVRLKDAEWVVELLKKENARLLEESRSGGGGGGGSTSRSGSASHFGPAASNLTIQQADRLRRDIPSLRSHAGRLAPNVMRRVFLSTSPRAAAARRDVSPGPSTVSTPSRAWVTIGTRVTWRGLQGVVQYLGRVDGLGDTITWAGLELLLQGAGDHDGLFDGVRYFETAPRSAVFASLGELLPPKEWPPVSPMPQPRASSSRSRSPPRHGDGSGMNGFVAGEEGEGQQNATVLDASFVRTESPVRRLQSDAASNDHDDAREEEEEELLQHTAHPLIPTPSETEEMDEADDTTEVVASGEGAAEGVEEDVHPLQPPADVLTVGPPSEGLVGDEPLPQEDETAPPPPVHSQRDDNDEVPHRQEEEVEQDDVEVDHQDDKNVTIAAPPPPRPPTTTEERTEEEEDESSKKVMGMEEEQHGGHDAPPPPAFDTQDQAISAVSQPAEDVNSNSDQVASPKPEELDPSHQTSQDAIDNGVRQEEEPQKHELLVEQQQQQEEPVAEGLEGAAAAPIEEGSHSRDQVEY